MLSLFIILILVRPGSEVNGATNDTGTTEAGTHAMSEAEPLDHTLSPASENEPL